MNSIERKLRVEICPYLVTARRLGRWVPYRVYVFYSYVGELFVLLAGFGFANPVITFLSGGQGTSNPGDSGTSQTIADFLAGSESAYISIGLLLVWGLLKFYIRDKDLEKRCNLLRNCMQQCGQLSSQLRAALAAAEPMQKLTDLQTNLADLVNSHRDALPYPEGIEPNIDDLVDNYCRELVSTFSPYWQPAPDHDRS